MNEDLISRQAARNAVRNLGEDYVARLKMLLLIEELPSAEERTAKVEEDEWIEHKMLSRDYGKIYYQHDCCCNLYESPYNFCPYCGKKMKRKNHD